MDFDAIIAMFTDLYDAIASLVATISGYVTELGLDELFGDLTSSDEA